MNNAPLTLILIASLGIVAVISLGVFFALRPKGLIEETTSYAGDENQKLQQQPLPVQQQPASELNLPLSRVKRRKTRLRFVESETVKNFHFKLLCFFHR